MGAVAAKAQPGAVVARTVAPVGQARTTLMRFPKAISVEDVVARYRAPPCVEWAGTTSAALPALSACYQAATKAG